MNNLDKQLIPYLEPVVKQVLDIIDEIINKENFDEGEVNELLYQLNDEFGEYINMLSPQTQGRILEIHGKLLNPIDVSDKEISIEDNI
jgi:transcription initiation factor TFIID subunit TAF12